MKVKIKPFVAYNLLLKGVIRKEELFREATKLLRYVVSQDAFPTGPVIYTTEKDGKYYVGVQVSDMVELHQQENMRFYKELKMEQCAFVRIYEEDALMKEAYQAIEEYVEDHQYEMVSATRYHVVLDVYGSVITDLYVPIKRKESL